MAYSVNVVAIRDLCAESSWHGARIVPSFESMAELRRLWGGRAQGDAGVTSSDLAFLPANMERESQIPPGWIVGEGPELRLVAVMEPSNPLSEHERLTPADLNGALLGYSDSDRHAMALTFWKCLRPLLKERGVRFQEEAKPFRNDSDWLVDLGQCVVIVPEAYYVVDSTRGLRKAVVPIEGLAMPCVSIYREDDELAAHVASLAVERAFV